MRPHSSKIVVDKTKIIATIGPACADPDVLKKMIIAGVDVCRLNFSHGSHEDHLKIIETVHAVNKELHTHIALLADLQGPKLRIGEVENNGVELVQGAKIVFSNQKCIGTAEKVYMSYPEFPKDVKPGEKVLVDDGKLMMRVITTNGHDEVVAEVVYGGTLRSKKGVNLPNTKISQPCLTEKDLKDLEFAVKHKVQWVALSFVRSAADIIEIKHVINKLTSGKKPLIMAKIEKPEALVEIDGIIAEADGLMVARGDLGVEIPLESVPLIQKNIVKKCIQAAKPVVIATQMMEGMINNFSPTRAEVNDVANAVMDGADALMLSGETSVGLYPVEVIATMQRIISQVEAFEDIYYRHVIPASDNSDRYISDSVIYSACEMAHITNADAIVAMTHSGYSALKLASQRPRSNIFIFTNNHAILSKLNLVWGIRGFYYDKWISTDHTIEDIIFRLKKMGYVGEGDLVINIASTPISEKGKTNTIKLSKV
jgi:pyruvate kinase